DLLGHCADCRGARRAVDSIRARHGSGRVVAVGRPRTRRVPGGRTQRTRGREPHPDRHRGRLRGAGPRLVVRPDRLHLVRLRRRVGDGPRRTHRRDDRADAAGATAGMTDAAARVLDAAVTARAFPGAAAEVGSSDGPLWTHVAGALTYDPDAPRVTCDTRYDVASLTKVIATTSIAMRQARDETLDLDALVQRWLPAWKDGPFAAVRVRDLLEHASGLPDWRPFFKLFDPHAVPDAARAVVVDTVAAESPAYAPRSKSVYSDVGFLLLGHVIERVAGERIDVPFTRLRDEAGLPASLRYGVDSNDAVAPTEVDSWRGRLLRGEV